MSIQNRHTLFIIDDNPDSLKPLFEFLEKSGFRIVIAKSSELALKRVTQVLPDLILLDVLMPDMDGFEICRRLKRCDAAKDVPVIFLTALHDTFDKVRGFQAGGADYLTKPVQFEEVLARIQAHLSIRKLQQQLLEQNQRFQMLSEATFEGLLIHEQGVILEVNQPLEEMFAYARGDVIGRNLLEFVPPDAQQIVREHLESADNIPYETRGMKSDGISFPIEVQARTIPYDGRSVRVVAVRDLSWRNSLEKEKQQLLKANLRERYKFGEIIGKSPAMQEIYESIVKASASDTNVIVYGESGTGKELVAREIHQRSIRHSNAFVAVNCGAVPDSIFENEFFGHYKGAFTGAGQDQPGYFDRAHKGTLFLDELGELPPKLQVKLLRVLENGEYMPVGGGVSKKADVRIIAATNKDLKDLLHHGKLREDFFYRLYVTVINLPPLRERKEDLPLLIDHFLNRYGWSEKNSRIPARILEALHAYDWPGNVRELQNELQRYCVEDRLELAGDLRVETPQAPHSSRLPEAVEALEKRMIVDALRQNFGHRGHTAKKLAIPLRSLHRKLKKYGLG